MLNKDGGLAWQALIRRFADGREVCNCRDAWYDADDGVHSRCRWGCAANQIAAKEEIALRVTEWCKAVAENK